MKTKTLFTITVAALSIALGLHAQDGGGIGDGVGVGVGVGTGIGGNIDVERVPGNVVQGRRVFAAKVVQGWQNTTNSQIFPRGGGSVTGISGIPRGSGSGFTQSGSIQSREFSTTVSIFNPANNPATFTYRGSGSAVVGPVTVTLQPMESHSVTIGTPPGPIIGPPVSMPLSTGFLAVESQAPLEVVALYHYREERIDFEDSAWIETAAGALFGPWLP